MTTGSLLYFSLMLTLIACGDKDGDSGGGDPDDCPSAEETGAELYTSNCAGCHGADGSGASGPSLQDAVPTLSDADIQDIMENGQDTMLPLSSLNCGEKQAIRDYLRDQHGDEGGA